MSRNTNIEELQFPVMLKPVYLKKHKYAGLSNYSAVTGIIDKKENVFSIVSRNYALISNNEATALGKIIFRKMFPESGEDEFIVFNINYPLTRSYCNIDLINKNYILNIWDKEVYVPFIRITNSYNRSRKLGFEIGFTRKVCDNGVIFERKFVSLNYFHYNRSFNFLKNNIKKDMKMKNLEDIERSFTTYMKNLREIKIEEKYFTPLTAKIFGLKFSTENVSAKQRKIIEKQKEEYLTIMQSIKNKYTEELGENAYGLFNTATAFANEKKFVKPSRYNDYQTKAGEWVKEIVRINNTGLVQKYLENCMNYLN